MPNPIGTLFVNIHSRYDISVYLIPYVCSSNTVKTPTPWGNIFAIDFLSTTMSWGGELWGLCLTIEWLMEIFTGEESQQLRELQQKPIFTNTAGSSANRVFWKIETVCSRSSEERINK